MKISANKNRVTITEREIISTGAYNAHWCEVSLSEDFEDLQNKVVFKTADTTIECNLVDGGCYVPMLTKVGRVEVGVYGYNGNQLIISPQMAVMTVNNGSYAENGEEPIVPDVPTYAEIKNAIDAKQNQLVFSPVEDALDIRNMQSGLYLFNFSAERAITIGRYGFAFEAPGGFLIVSRISTGGGAFTTTSTFIYVNDGDVWSGKSEYMGNTFVAWTFKKMAIDET